MLQTVSEVMTPEPVTLDLSSSVADAARVMRDCGIGDVIVVDGRQLYGIVTDRDIVVRAVASRENPNDVSLAQICSREISSVEPTTSVSDAIRLMREKALRRLPVLHNGRPVGIICLGDLAVEQDPFSPLAEISVAQPNS